MFFVSSMSLRATDNCSLSVWITRVCSVSEMTTPVMTRPSCSAITDVVNCFGTTELGSMMFMSMYSRLLRLAPVRSGAMALPSP